MPSKSEYDAAFHAEGDSIMSMPVDTKRDASKHHAEAARRIVRKRNEFTKGISDLWRQRFTEIKRENDDLQAALKDSYREAITEIGARWLDQVEGLQR